MQIHHLQHKLIDFRKWDDTILSSANHLGYAYSWYLDIVSPGWEALVTDDYEFIMPLPVKRKYKIPYLVQPVLTQQLGIFSKNEISDEVIQLFIKNIPYYSYELNMNERNFNAEVTKLPNYVLKLKDPYENIQQKYSKNTVRNIEKAQKNNVRIVDKIEIEEFISLFSQVNPNAIAVIKSTYRAILTTGTKNKMITISGAYNTKDELIAGICHFFTGKRIVCLLPVSNAEAKKTSAMFLLIDSLIRTFAETDRIVDFEGSQIEGIARFYRGFGAADQPYYLLKKFRPNFLVGKI